MNPNFSHAFPQKPEPTHPFELLKLTPLVLAERCQIRFESKIGTLLADVPLLEQLKGGGLLAFHAFLWPDAESHNFLAFVHNGQIELQAGRKGDIITHYDVAKSILEESLPTESLPTESLPTQEQAPLQIHDLSQFYKLYLPLENSEGLFLFDSDRGDWHRMVLEATPLARVWSYHSSDSDGSVIITPGRALVNLLGLVIATVERTRPEEENLQFQD